MARAVNKRIVIVCLLWAVSAIGRGQAPAWKTAVLTGAITLDSLTHYMNIYTDIRLTFNSGKINGSRAVLFPGKTYDVNSLLIYIQEHTGLTWSLYGKHVIFRDDPRKKAPVSVVRKKPVPKPALRPKRAMETPKVVRQSRAGMHVELVRVDTIKRNIVTIDTRVKKKNLSLVQDSSSKENTTLGKGPSLSNWVLHAGVFANEVFYTNVGIEAGIKPISLLFSVGSNFHVTTWHIGLLSGALKIGKLPVHLTAGYSPLSAKANGIDSGLQSKVNITVKGQLYDLGLATYHRHGKHWLFKISLDTRLLKTTYYRDGSPIMPGRYFLQGQDPDKTLYLVRPPLKYSNTFDRSSSTNVKIWPGITIGFYYNFF